MLMNFGGWVLHVNECLRDASTVPSGQSGSDEERKEDAVVSLQTASVSRVAETTGDSRETALPRDPCLFYSYTAGCAKGQTCEYSHSIHADQVAAPVAKQKRGLARHRIKRRLAQHFAAENLYDVQEHLQREARQSSYAKGVIRSYLTGSDGSTSATSASTRAAMPMPVWH